MEALDALGAGFALAASDLDRRGAGDLFGEEQSGHLALVGPALHAEMLAAALRAERGEPNPTLTEIRIEAPAALPESYIPEPDLRVTLYNRLARAHAPDEAERLADEVEDRFGPPPPEARALLRLAAIRARAGVLGVTRVSAGPEAVALDFAPAARPEEVPGDLDWVGERLVWRQPLADAAERLDATLEVLARLA
jgi:transcription-repair coupling factor (superfamily II helicase)